jgi:hypothetical protein
LKGNPSNDRIPNMPVLNQLIYFSGGTRVVQFMTGGWIDNNLPNVRKYKSETHTFPHDIAPTLLDMAGGDVNLLLGGRTGATYGNSLWEVIKNSLDPTETGKPQQLVRKVSYSKTFFFDVQASRTLKSFFTGNTPIPMPRLWDPIWPKNGDLLMYVSRHQHTPTIQYIMIIQLHSRLIR